MTDAAQIEGVRREAFLAGARAMREAAADVACNPAREGREWVPGSFWDTLANEQASAIRSLDPQALLDGEVVSAAIDALTRRAGETYEDFIERCGKNDIARRIKLLDLEDNMDMSRLGRIPNERDRKRYDKYERARARLHEIDDDEFVAIPRLTNEQMRQVLDNMATNKREP